MRGVPLGELVAEADAVLTRANPDLVATAVVATYHPPTRVLRVANGGHPPALLVRGADARYLDAPGRGVGFPLAGSDATEELELDAGDRVVFYTDGLIEGGRDVVAGLRQLARIAVSSTASHPSAFAGELVTRASAGARERDDCACVVLQAEP
jgi:serine phosphatase RsbU (regulator of sigma subunit)